MPSKADHCTELSYSASFFKDLDRVTRASAEVIVPMVMEQFAPTSVVDVGCGHGVWLSLFLQAGVERITGLDGSWVDQQDLKIPSECFRSADLASQWCIPGRFDLALCLEVGEHLTESVSARLVENLTKAAHVVLFSAALPGQEGTLHINEQWPEFWEELFARRGFVRLDPFRRRIWQDSRVAWYYQQNLMAFAAAAVVEESTKLQEERDRAANCEVTLVHRKILRPMKQARPALHLLPRLVFEAARRKWNRLFG